MRSGLVLLEHVHRNEARAEEVDRLLPSAAAKGLIMPKRVGGVTCCNPRCQKSTYELPWPSGEIAKLLADEVDAGIASTGSSPASTRPRRTGRA